LIGFAALTSLTLVGCAPDPPDGPTIATLSSYAVRLTSTPVHLGTNRFLIENRASIEHELVAFKIDQPVADLPRTPTGDLDEDVLDNVSDGDNLAPATSTQRIVKLTEPGTYLFVCNLPGHFEKGMYSTVTLP
jgi:uncharacterized cupredoxin-like copper-binding protein